MAINFVLLITSSSPFPNIESYVIAEKDLSSPYLLQICNQPPNPSNAGLLARSMLIPRSLSASCASHCFRSNPANIRQSNVWLGPCRWRSDFPDHMRPCCPRQSIRSTSRCLRTEAHLIDRVYTRNTIVGSPRSNHPRRTLHEGPLMCPADSNRYVSHTHTHTHTIS